MYIVLANTSLSVLNYFRPVNLQSYWLKYLSMLYKRPPIQEAVIELRFAQEVQADILGELQKLNVENYPLPAIPNAMLGIEMRDNELRVEQRLVGLILTGQNGEEKQTIGPRNFGVSVIGSYPGWDKLVARFHRDRKNWERKVGRLLPSRLGIRYVNRIDVPAGDTDDIDWAIYLNTFVHLPDEMRKGTINEQQMRYVGGPLGAGNWQLTLSVAKTLPAILGHQSLLLDIDIGTTQIDNMKNTVDSLLLEGHDIKNRLFEASITDVSRELFQK